MADGVYSASALTSSVGRDKKGVRYAAMSTDSLNPDYSQKIWQVKHKTKSVLALDSCFKLFNVQQQTQRN